MLPSGNFLVSVSSDTDSVASRGWIELRDVNFNGSPLISQLVAEFHLPEFDEAMEYHLRALKFYSSEQPNWITKYKTDERTFPFVSDPNTFVYVLQIWYHPRPGRTNQGTSKMYLIISNRVFANVLKKWARRNDPNNDASFPLRIEWDEWGPLETSMWGDQELDESVTLTNFKSFIHHPQDVVSLW
jgi:hypothetical protein